MGFIQDIKTDPATQQLWLKRIEDRPWLINALATSVSGVSRALAPLVAAHTALRTKYKSQTLQLKTANRIAIKSKLDSYMDMMSTVSDGMGFIEADCCDALLFTGLVGAVGFKVAITVARNPDGSWERREITHPCYPDGAASTISRDMITGLLWYFWRNNRLDLAMEMWNYGKTHSWIMGRGDPSRIYLTPGLQATLAEIIYRLGGENFWIERHLPQMWSKGLQGYQAHLQILHVLLRGELNGEIDGSMLSCLNDMNTTYPDNHLCTLARARFAQQQWTSNFMASNVAAGLQDQTLWPNNRLPSEFDRSSHWFFENNDRSKGADPGALHTGGDLVFCASLLLEYNND